MVYHYLINMDPSLGGEIEHATFHQNLKWINQNKPYRIEYLGTNVDKFGMTTKDLILTGVDLINISIRELENLLLEFSVRIDTTYDEFVLPIYNFTRITTDEVREIYYNTKIEIDPYLLLEKYNQSEILFEYVKKVYYDYHLESLLNSCMREVCEEYMSKKTSSEQLTEKQNKTMKSLTNRALILGLGIQLVPKRIIGNAIIYGKYHVSFGYKKVWILPYAKRIKNMHTQIMDFAFDGCDGLESIIIGDDIFYFGDFVFRNCTNLKSVTLNDNMEIIPENTFLNCTSLQELKVPESIKIIGEHAFDSCQALNDANLFRHTSLKKIGDNAFIDCRGLKSIILPETLFDIGDYAFARSGLENIEIPGTVHSIGYGAFEDCERLKWVIFPREATEVPPWCFSGCTELESIILNEGIIEIDDEAFSDCQKLKEIIIPDGVESIGDEVFKGCTSLIKVVFPESVNEIGNCNFDNCTIIYCEENSYIHKHAIEEEWNFQII